MKDIFFAFEKEGIRVDQESEGVFSIPCSDVNGAERIQGVFAKSLQFLKATISLNKQEGKFIITVTQTSDHASKSGRREEAIEVRALPPPKDRVSKLRTLLENYRFIFDPSRTPPSKAIYRDLEQSREFLGSIFNKVLQRAIDPFWRKGEPWVEIGPDLGYSWSEEQEESCLSIQSNRDLCHFLANRRPASYQMNIETLCKFLQENKEKISLFFALNVFDTFPDEELKKNLRQLSQCQKSGDHLIIALDANPDLGVCLGSLRLKFLHYKIYPYMPEPSDPLKVILIPHSVPSYYQGKYTLDTIKSSFMEEIEFFKNREGPILSNLQENIADYTSQASAEFHIISLEEWYIDRMRRFVDTEYAIDYMRYQMTYSVMPSEEVGGLHSCWYRATTNNLMGTINLPLTHKSLSAAFAGKNLQQNFLNEEMEEELAKSGKKIGCVEILVLAATKR
jgi:hypothetical protein